MHATKVTAKISEATRTGSKKIAPRRLEYYEKVRRERLRLLIVTEGEANAFRAKLEAEAHQNKSPPKASDIKTKHLDTKEDKAKVTKASSSKPVRTGDSGGEKLTPARRVRTPVANAEHKVVLRDNRNDQRRASSASAVQHFSTSLANRLLAEAALQENAQLHVAKKEQNLDSLNDQIEKAFADFERWSVRPNSNRTESEIQQRSAPASRSASQHPSPNTLPPDSRLSETNRTEAKSKSKSESNSPAKRVELSLRIEEPVVHPLPLRGNAPFRLDSVTNASLPNLNKSASVLTLKTSPTVIAAAKCSKPVATIRPTMTASDHTPSTLSSDDKTMNGRVDQILRNAVAIEREWNRFKMASSAHEARSERLSASLTRLVRTITSEAEQESRPNGPLHVPRSALFPDHRAGNTVETNFQVELGGAWAAPRRTKTFSVAPKTPVATQVPRISVANQSPSVTNAEQTARTSPPLLKEPDANEKRSESPRRVAFDLNTIRSIPYSIRKPLYSGIVARAKRAAGKPGISILKKDATHHCDAETDEFDASDHERGPSGLQSELSPDILSSSAPQ